MFNISKCADDTQMAPLPHSAPEEAVEEYFKSKQFTNLVKKFPVWDSAGREGGLATERARVAAVEAGELLDATKATQTGYRKDLDARWKALAGRQNMLRQSFIKFNKFVSENQNKRDRASKNLSADKKTYALQCQKVDHLKVELAELAEVCSNMEHYLQKHTMYENYLLTVVDAYKEFHQPSDIINRFEALTNAKTNLSIRQESDLSKLQDTCAEMSRLTESKKLHIMRLNNDLAGLRLRYDNALNESKKWELVLSRVKETTAKKQLEHCRVKDSLRALYLTICKQKGIDASADTQDYDSQLVVVMRALIELRNIVKAAKLKASQNSMSSGQS